ncbi:diguanylate cyclase [Paenibacillus sp. HJL G12]|uniref:Diguanylate cyclase n=1 Tax=Paenibacillus dendrobii TaxID=2691084 RepID=A0A7X3LIM5_9BACL|nr:sensor domain-containing diguanylate cyclase [Paenibacillus dendrobii]MWV46312.1 diguanylate cyclase [Paenibacillus dendrobii]
MDERLKYAPCGYVSITHEGIVADVNQTFLDLMGYSHEDLIQKHLESIMSTANKLIFHSYFYPQINLSGRVEELFISLKDKDKQSIPFILNGRRFVSDGVEVIDCVLVQMRKRIDYEQELRSAKKQIEEAYWQKDQALAKLEQIHREIEQKQAELMEMNAILVELSVTDKLTGLKNRRFFQEKLDEQVHVYGTSRKPFSLVIIDIDHFKKVNDTWGHQMGDQVLESLARILTSHARGEDVVARLGGEEFVLILPNTDGPDSKKVAERLRLAVAGFTCEIGSFTVSMGIATFAPGDTDASLLKKADEALYTSKENGRNRVTHIMDLK